MYNCTTQHLIEFDGLDKVKKFMFVKNTDLNYESGVHYNLDSRSNYNVECYKPRYNADYNHFPL